MDWVLLALIAIPIGAVLVFMLIPSRYPQLVRNVALVSGFAMFALSVLVFVKYEFEGGSGFRFDLQLAWLENVAFLGKDGISLHLAVDGISAPMVLLTGIVIFAGVFISWNIDYRNKDYFVLLFLLVSGVFGVFLSLDLFFLFFFYEVAVLPMYLLIAVWGTSSHFGTFTRPKEYAAMKLVLYLVGGSALIFVGIFATFMEAGQGTFDLPVLGAVTYDENFQKVVFPLYALGFGILAGLWPFHTWSPDGHVAAPTAVSMLHAGVLMKLGAFGILRVAITLFPEGAQFWAPVLMTLGVTGALYGAISAMAQRDLKYMVGYSSVSHMGFVLMGLATLTTIGVNGAVLQMFAHGVMTALMFAMVGAVYDQAHVRDMTMFGGLAQKTPRLAAFFAIAGLSSLGLPGLAGFVAEFHIFVGAFNTYPWAGALGILAAAITATYILRMLAMVFFGPFNERWAGLKEMRRGEQFGGALLIAFIIFMGVWPAPFIDRISESVEFILRVGASGP
ncbi:MAG: NADH-quinone oxidoreductase subunit M [Chloroflexi bacterium]|nr:NADH-quinone oxidoreductase subunit M [Chloroflexota bacterium]